MEPKQPLPIPHVVKGFDEDGTPIVDFPNDALSHLMAAMHETPQVHVRTRKLFEKRLQEIGAELADGGIPIKKRKDTIYCLLGTLFMLYSEEVSDFLDDAGYAYVGDEEPLT